LIPPNRASAVFNHSSAQQGAMFIYRNFCESGQMNCSKCSIYSMLE